MEAESGNVLISLGSVDYRVLGDGALYGLSQLLH